MSQFLASAGANGLAMVAKNAELESAGRFDGRKKNPI
jgi:hypothetical protein